MERDDDAVAAASKRKAAEVMGKLRAGMTECAIATPKGPVMVEMKLVAPVWPPGGDKTIIGGIFGSDGVLAVFNGDILGRVESELTRVLIDNGGPDEQPADLRLWVVEWFGQWLMPNGRDWTENLLEAGAFRESDAASLAMEYGGRLGKDPCRTVPLVDVLTDADDDGSVARAMKTMLQGEQAGRVVDVEPPREPIPPPWPWETERAPVQVNEHEIIMSPVVVVPPLVECPFRFRCMTTTGDGAAVQHVASAMRAGVAAGRVYVVPDRIGVPPFRIRWGERWGAASIVTEEWDGNGWAPVEAHTSTSVHPPCSSEAVDWARSVMSAVLAARR